MPPGGSVEEPLPQHAARHAAENAAHVEARQHGGGGAHAQAAARAEVVAELHAHQAPGQAAREPLQKDEQHRRGGEEPEHLGQAGRLLAHHQRVAGQQVRGLLLVAVASHAGSDGRRRANKLGLARAPSGLFARQQKRRGAGKGWDGD